MNSFRKNIRDIAEEALRDSGFFLIDMIVRGHDNDRVIELFIDGENNITAEDCAEMSRKINNYLEENKIITSPYRLDISSPGIDRPLLYLKQYPKHINRKFDITFNADGEDKNLTGVLKNVNGEQLTFFSDKEVQINFKEIIKAKVLVSFS
jgi:ribosome maturation factor RimP